MNAPPTKLLRKSDPAARYLRQRHGLEISPRTLDRMRSTGGGPAFARVGRAIYYSPQDLDAWALEILSRRLTKTQQSRPVPLSRRGAQTAPAAEAAA